VADPPALLGKRLDELLPRAEPQNVDRLRSFIRSGYRLSGAESTCVDGDGNPKHVVESLTGIVEEGCLVAVWGTQLDVTAQRRREEEVRRQAEDLIAADRRKNQFLAVMAHELRNPLAPILNSIELMRRAETADASFGALRSLVERQVQQLARLVDDLLDASRIAHGNVRLRREMIDLRAVVERAAEATRPLIEMRGHLFSLRLPPQAVRLDCDAARLEKSISNLLENAARYTMPEGQIWLTVERENQEAVVRVRDNGIGLPPEILDRIFEPFSHGDDGALVRSEAGLGIGLSLVRSLIEMHGGSVEAHSPGLGQGSEFILRLPIRAGHRADSRPAAGSGAARDPRDWRRSRDADASRDVAAEPGVAGLSVLVVEDNLDAAETLANLLRFWGHQVSTVQDGQGAVELARAERPQVVLLDIGLPGLDGYQVARRLRAELGLHETLVVAMTGYGQPEDRRRSREAGIDYHFVKPVEPDVLRSLLASLPIGAKP
jgi:signal transduction histidine kinase